MLVQERGGKSLCRAGPEGGGWATLHFKVHWSSFTTGAPEIQVCGEKRTGHLVCSCYPSAFPPRTGRGQGRRPLVVHLPLVPTTQLDKQRMTDGQMHVMPSTKMQAKCPPLMVKSISAAQPTQTRNLHTATCRKRAHPQASSLCLSHTPLPHVRGPPGESRAGEQQCMPCSMAASLSASDSNTDAVE